MKLTCRLLASMTAALWLAGCAATGDEPAKLAPSPADPWEPTNRAVYRFNTRVDNATLRPTARAYRAAVPTFLRRRVSNFFANLGYPAVVINDVLQGKIEQGGEDLMRFVLNSTVGLGGLFDVATSAGLEENDEDFGQTLAVWGVPSGPYVSVPFFGPSSVRDAPALIVDFVLDGRNYIGGTQAVSNALLAVDVLDLRTRLLSAETLLEDAYDPYLTIREAWLQRREFQIYDGDPPLDDEFEDEFLDEFIDDTE